MERERERLPGDLTRKPVDRFRQHAHMLNRAPNPSYIHAHTNTHTNTHAGTYARLRAPDQGGGAGFCCVWLLMILQGQRRFYRARGLETGVLWQAAGDCLDCRFLWSPKFVYCTLSSGHCTLYANYCTVHTPNSSTNCCTRGCGRHAAGAGDILRETPRPVLPL